MSILPIQSQGSNSSSSFDSISQNPNSSNHGSNSSISSSLSHQFHSLQFSRSSALLASAADDSAGSSRKVSELRTSIGKKTLSHQDGETNGQGAEYAQSRGKMSETKTSPRGQQTNGPINGQGGSPHSTGRKAQMVNANHLLNFQYDPIARSQPRAPPPIRRQQKIKPYNKDLFLQANYKFVLLDRGDYAPEMMDPDKMLSWEDIICVRYATPVSVQCPICLEYPLCPQITTCGHIFCFPCILRCLLMGREDFKGECFRRCPLCFVMVSQKDLHTIYIENVKQYSVGDTVKFMLLSRQKDSFTPFQRSNPEIGSRSFNENNYDPFAQFIFTSDVELSVRNAISDLDSWLAKADSGLVDDLEKLPYVCAAMEKLEQRKKYWNEQLCDSDRNYKPLDSQKQSQEFLSAVNVTFPEDGHSDSRCLTQSIENNDEKKQLETVKLDNAASVEDQGTTSSSLHTESKSFQKINDAYNFYQAVDGQHLILHPLNMKCLLHHYGSYDMLPQGISGKILQLELVTQSEAMRRRYRYLSHFSLTTTFHLCEIDLSEVLPPDSLLPFMDEIKKREKQRKELAKRERKEKLKGEAEAAAAASYPVSISSGTGHSSYEGTPKFSMDDFEALRSSTAMSSSPPVASSPPVVGERVLFSNVARLGFAAGHDSPTLKIDEGSGPHSNKVTNVSTGVSGIRNPGTPTFANVTSRAKGEENLNAPKTNDAGKKGKKPNRVLLSTAGGRRY